MPGLNYIDRPVLLPRELYDEAVDGIIRRNCGLPGLKAIYRFGNINSPGISDLDLLFVFRQDVVCTRTGLEELPPEHKPLFTHGIMALCENQFIENEHYTLWSEHTLVWGDDTPSGIKSRTREQTDALKIQTAVEFLLANYIDIKIQKTYGVIKLRAFLQHMKGILYDLDYLNDENAPLRPLLTDLKSSIKNWFAVKRSSDYIQKWLHSFEDVYDDYVNQTLQKHPLYLPAGNHYRIAKNMVLKNGKQLTFERTGLLLPSALAAFGRRYVKLQHRFNQFRVECPLCHEAPEIVTGRFDFLKRMKAYNRVHLPNFMTITTSITAKLI
ncbi:MAG: hypothetical protein JNL88_12265 [Bacteroidia bacterium]|nr:hypothetical protein [Bacteroidia bacterium]